MKRALRYIVSFFLLLTAKVVLRRYHPKIVMITGSVGKTSTKDAVAAVLSTRFAVIKSEKSFNSEFGVPFTILGVENPWNNPFAWISLIKRAAALLFLPNHYPNLLVLEVGADKPGDLARILRIATPDAVVVTRLPNMPVHVEAYASPEAVREEEFSPACALEAGAQLIISADDAYATKNAPRTTAHITSYGEAENADVRVSMIDFLEEGGAVTGMRANLSTTWGEGDTEAHARGSVGTTQMWPLAAAVATAHAFDISLPDAVAALAHYEPPAGRGRLFKGVNGSIIIDDTYNSSPVAVEKALATLKAFPCTGKRVAVLGDMLELGRYSVSEHTRIGEVACASADMVAAVGIRARVFSDVSCTADVRAFDDSRLAAEALPHLVGAGDVILVKGSQSIRTEHIVKALLADPADANRLVRQERRWLAIA